VTILLAAWISLAPVLTPRQEIAVASANGKVYIVGGLSGMNVLSSVEEYDPQTNQWRFVASVPAPVHHAAAATLDGSIYVIGGYRTASFAQVSDVYRYDPTADVWTRLNNLPSSRGAAAAAAIDGKIYVAGGAPTFRELLVYDPAVDRWSALASMPTPRSGLAAAVLNNRIYVFGGEGNPSTISGVFSENESYDAITATWRSELPMATPRHGIGAAAISGRIFIPAGATVAGFGTSDINDAFVPDTLPRRRAVRR